MRFIERIRPLFRLFLLFTFLAVVAVISAITTIKLTIQGNQETLPDLAGMKQRFRAILSSSGPAGRPARCC